jgi:sulfur carrier protein
VKIKVNNEQQELEKEISIADLLILNKVDMPDMVSVQLNGEFLQREEFQETIIKDNDEVDFLYFMGGGANRG